MTSLHPFIVEGKFDAIKKMIQADPSCVNRQDISGNTPLHTAIAENKDQIASFLLNTKADPNITSHYNNNESPLYVAVCKKKLHGKLIRQLLQHKADPLVKRSDSGLTPLHVAFKLKNAKLLYGLIKFSSNPKYALKASYTIASNTTDVKGATLFVDKVRKKLIKERKSSNSNNSNDSNKYENDEDDEEEDIEYGEEDDEDDYEDDEDDYEDEDDIDDDEDDEDDGELDFEENTNSSKSSSPAKQNPTKKTSIFAVHYTAEQLMCVVSSCRAPLSNHIYSCEKGHRYCSNCYGYTANSFSFQSRCALCKNSQNVLSRDISLEKEIEKNGHLCPAACGTKILDIHLKEHKKRCLYGVQNCFLCNKQVSYAQYFAHVQGGHCKTPFRTHEIRSLNSTSLIEIGAQNTAILLSSNNVNTPIRQFVVVFSPQPSEKAWAVWCVSLQKLSNDYETFCIVNVQRKRARHTVTVPLSALGAVTWGLISAGLGIPIKAQIQIKLEAPVAFSFKSHFGVQNSFLETN